MTASYYYTDIFAFGRSFYPKRRTVHCIQAIVTHFISYYHSLHLNVLI